MNVTCPKCSAVYKVDESKISGKSIYARCPKCKERFLVKKDIGLRETISKSESIECPHCQQERNRDDVRCSKCGIIFEKYQGLNDSGNNQTINGRTGEESETKKCPFCAEEIRVDAIKCKHCGEYISAGKADIASKDDSGSGANLIYILYLFSLLIPIIAIVALIMAYAKKFAAPDWVQSHYRFQIRTFWIGLLYSFFALLVFCILVRFSAILVLLEFIIALLFNYVWWIVRCVKGKRALGMSMPYPNPKAWMFG